MQYPMFKVHMPVEEVMTKIKSVLDSGFLNEGLAFFCRFYLLFKWFCLLNYLT